MTVYKIWNDVNDKLYIGITAKPLEHRWKQHLEKSNRGVDTHLYNAMRKYGTDKFHIAQIDVAESYADLLEKEKYYIGLYDSYNNGYNMTYGGDTNPMDAMQSKEKHDDIMRSNEVRQKISNTMKEKAQRGELFSDEHRKHLSDASFKRYGNDTHTYKKSQPNKAYKKPSKKEPKEYKPYSPPILNRKMLFDLEGKRHYVTADMYEELISQGWYLPTSKKRGEEPNPHTKQLHTYQSHMSKEEKHDILSKSHLGISPPNKGVPLSEEQKHYLSEYFKGTKWMNNGSIQKQVQPNKFDEFLSNGFVFGQLKKNKGGDSNVEENHDTN